MRLNCFCNKKQRAEGASVSLHESWRRPQGRFLKWNGKKEWEGGKEGNKRAHGRRPQLVFCMRQNNTDPQLWEVEMANMMKLLSSVAVTDFSLPSNLPYNVTPQQALCHPEVQRRLDVSLGHLLVLADKFLSAILSSVDKIPYGFSAMTLSICCHPSHTGVGTCPPPARNKIAGLGKWPPCHAISGPYNEILLELVLVLVKLQAGASVWLADEKN